MLYLYDECIVNDLQASFAPSDNGQPVVRVIDPAAAIGVAAQIQADHISLPIVALTREDGINIDTTRTNFTRLHRGVQAVIDNSTIW